MAISDVSLSFLTQTSTTFEPPLGLLNPGEGFVNSADGRFWIGTTTDTPLEIGLNSRSGLISNTGKYLERRTSFNSNTGLAGDGYTNVNIPYSPTNLGTQEYYEFYIFFIRDDANAFNGTYSQDVNWGSIPDPLPDVDQDKSLLVKFFQYGFDSEWYAVPVWSDDETFNLFKGSEAKFYYTEIEAPSGLVMPQRARLKFQSITTATVSDDLANNTTVVELGRNLVTRIVSQPTVSLDYNLSEYYILDGTSILDLPGAGSPTDPFEFIVKNINASDVIINQGTLSTLSQNETALILYDGVNYNHVLYGGGGGGGGSTIATQDEGVTIDPVATTLNFVGAGVTAANVGSNVTEITIPGGGGSSDVVNEETLSGTKTLSAGDPNYQVLNPNGAARDVILPDPPTTNEVYTIVNDSDGLAGNTLNIKETAAGAVEVVMDDTTGIFNLRAVRTPTKWIYIN